MNTETQVSKESKAISAIKGLFETDNVIHPVMQTLMNDWSAQIPKLLGAEIQICIGSISKLLTLLKLEN